MASNSQEVESVSGKSLRNKDGSVTELIQWATQGMATPEEIMDAFLEAEIPISTGTELTGDYRVVTPAEKVEWCSKHVGTPLFVVQWHFYGGRPSEEDPTRLTNEFAAMHIVSAFGKFIVNDSAKGGMYGNLRQITDEREAADPSTAVKRTSTAGAHAMNGLKGNRPFWYNTKTGKSIPKSELDDTVKHPMSDRKESTPTWSFDWR